MLRQLTLAAILLLACSTAPAGRETSDTPASVPASAAAASDVPAASMVSASPSTSAAEPSASVASATPEASVTTAPAASAAAPSGCSKDARRDKAARFCITLGDKVSPVSYSGSSPDEGIEELLDVGPPKKSVRIVLTRSPAGPVTSVLTLREYNDKPDTPGLVDRGDLPAGYWNEKRASNNQRRVEGVILSGKYVVHCMGTGDEADVETARAVCKSLRTF
ncbi:MAG: hypothetical protein HOV80_21305 [Polyangiaceae bacterium]|nr:hypothetical protein [Polyangiaceae bacterium]